MHFYLDPKTSVPLRREHPVKPFGYFIFYLIGLKYHSEPPSVISRHPVRTPYAYSSQSIARRQCAGTSRDRQSSRRATLRSCTADTRSFSNTRDTPSALRHSPTHQDQLRRISTVYLLVVSRHTNGSTIMHRRRFLFFRCNRLTKLIFSIQYTPRRLTSLTRTRSSILPGEMVIVSDRNRTPQGLRNSSFAGKRPSAALRAGLA